MTTDKQIPSIPRQFLLCEFMRGAHGALYTAATFTTTTSTARQFFISPPLDGVSVHILHFPKAETVHRLCCEEEC